MPEWMLLEKSGIKALSNNTLYAMDRTDGEAARTEARVLTDDRDPCTPHAKRHPFQH